MKDNGPDKILSQALKGCTPQISPYLTVIFNQSLTEQDLPEDWLKGNVCLMCKKEKGKIQLNIDLSPLRVWSVKLWSYIPSCFWTSEPLRL